MSTRTRSDAQLARIAVLGMITLVVLVLGAVNFSRLPLVGADLRSYHAEFGDAAGLVAGEEVRVAGLKVGRVTDISLDRGKVRVTFEVEGLDVGDRSTAGIEVKTLLGQHYLSLEPSGRPLPEGGLIPLSRTSTPVNIVPAFNQLASQTAQLDTEQVSEAFDALSSVLERTAPDMRRTLRGLTRLSRAVTSRDEEIRTLFERTNQVSGVVAARDQELGELLTSTTQVLDILDRRRETITQIIDGTSRLSRQLAGLVKDNQGQLKPALTKLTGVLDVLRANRKQIDQILDNGTAYGREFTNVGGTGRWFDATIKLPQNFALCTSGNNGVLDSLLGTVLTQLNQAINKSPQPCLPLGPANEVGP